LFGSGALATTSAERLIESWCLSDGTRALGQTQNSVESYVLFYLRHPAERQKKITEHDSFAGPGAQCVMKAISLEDAVTKVGAGR
jgi:hypothetical protein